MALPVVFVHGYLAEGVAQKNDVQEIYGDLPRQLKQEGQAVADILLSKYVTLDDGITIDDLSAALNIALRDAKIFDRFSGGFAVLIHSTGALVVRNWIRRFSPAPSPVKMVVYLAGALFGSGWAHLGNHRVSKWLADVVGSVGVSSDRGAGILESLELGSPWTLDLHTHFLESATSMAGNYRIAEVALIGSEPPPRWDIIPVGYARENGSDGVVRVAAGNPNVNYLRIRPAAATRTMSFAECDLYEAGLRKNLAPARHYFASTSTPESRGLIPFALLPLCSHTYGTGIISGQSPRATLLPLLKRALESTPATWAQLIADFDDVTATTLKLAAHRNKPLLPFARDRRKAYDPHAQVVFRMRDQHGQPIKSYDIYFEPCLPPGVKDADVETEREKLGRLHFEDQHRNREGNVLTFHFRTATHVDDKLQSLVAAPDGCRLEITARQPESDRVRYVPVYFELTQADLDQWLHPRRTTVVDIEMQRIASPSAFVITPLS